ncbi:MAG: dTMP kinase [Thermoplasmata archaeon]|nr:dTMP kinase [Thermoplasmata archaeon]NIS10996.1 dTMP kinase [Thermoplasmata archaeon]NIT75977.1 dTMP kinase [Thermoplasmata archaeon]NIU51226.1 dTMP kinase [Thermoplasmata archaeon]NIV80938.1 dTMP kinase [Thermoplasmata archaeon]
MMQRRDAPEGDVGSISSEDLDDVLASGQDLVERVVTPGKLVVLEGIDGTGKSYIAERVVRHLEAREVSAIATSEPTEGAAGRLLKKVLSEGVDPYTELFLFMADRADHVLWMRARLREGNWVVCDRYAMSSAAYQGTYLEEKWETRGRDPVAWIMDQHRPWWIEPDLTVLIVDDIDRCLDRVRERGPTSKFERRAYLERVQANYLSIAETTDGVVVVDDPELEDIEAAVLGRVEAILGNRR